MNKILLIWILLSCYLNVSAAVTVVSPTALIKSCSYPSFYYPLGVISITENMQNDFSIPSINTNYTLVLQAPSGFEFNPGVGSVTNNGGDVTSTSVIVSSSSITINISSNEASRANEFDQINLIGLQIRANAVSNGIISRSTSSSIFIAGVSNSIPFATVSSINNCCGLVSNSGFNEGSTDWDFCGNLTECYAYETTYGGTNSTNRVAEVDAQVSLCQNITGLIPGAVYTLSFKYSKRNIAPSTPLRIYVPGSTVPINLNVNLFSYWQTYNTTFTATSTNGELRFNVDPTFTGGTGVVLDDVCILPPTALPTEIIDFEASLKSNDNAHLSWKAISEIECDFYTIEKTQTGEKWDLVGIVKGQGSSNREQNYWIEDSEVQFGTNYYRLSQTNLNGIKTEIDTKSLNRVYSNNFSIIPNPSNGQFSIYGLKNETYKISIYDVMGKLFAKTEDITTLTSLDFTEGSYTILVEQNNHVEYLKLLIVE
jgi:hypothetical protein